MRGRDLHGVVLGLAQDAHVGAGGPAPGRLVVVPGVPLDQIPDPALPLLVEAALGGFEVTGIGLASGRARSAQDEGVQLQQVLGAAEGEQVDAGNRHVLVIPMPPPPC